MKNTKIFKISFALILVACMLASLAVCAFASGNVTYTGRSEQFVFTPGSEYSPTDLFENFKGVLPGDKLDDTVVIKNAKESGIKINLYMRSLGADEESKDFLSQLKLTVKGAEGNKELYNAPSDQSAQLTEWVNLGTILPGAEITLDLELSVPTDLDEKYMDKVGKLTWEFKAEEIPEEIPVTPVTGDAMNTTPYVIAIVLAVVAIVGATLFIVKRRKNNG